MCAIACVNLMAAASVLPVSVSASGARRKGGEGGDDDKCSSILRAYKNKVVGWAREAGVECSLHTPTATTAPQEMITTAHMKKKEEEEDIVSLDIVIDRSGTEDNAAPHVVNWNNKDEHEHEHEEKEKEKDDVVLMERTVRVQESGSGREDNEREGDGGKPSSVPFVWRPWFLSESITCPCCGVQLRNRERLLRHLIDDIKCRADFYEMVNR